ncbi:hypothetical protein DVH24_014063 [Malus domestica]|uniref:Uncharacterized protein n=1 Tax=Malus domestica TaxID=3750 RepID=A0A498JFA0_MALDO|nr:hypothetical protein DVH24_014063 [Malus domestica]
MVRSHSDRSKAAKSLGVGRRGCERKTFLKGAFGTWDGTGRNGTRRSVPRLVRQKWVERVVPRDRFWVFLRPTSPPGTGLFHVCGTQCFTILRQIYPMSFSKITPSFRPVLSRSVPSRPVPFRSVCVPNAP